MIFALARLFGRSAPRPPSRDALAAMPDEALMLQYGQGETLAFEILLERHEKAVYRFIYRSLHDEERAAELTQDVFVRVIRSADRYRESAKFTTWLFTIARNLCIDESRRRRHAAVATLDAPAHRDSDGGDTLKDRLADDTAVSGGGNISREQFMSRLQQGLQALPEEQREVFLLRHIEGMKFVEIASMFGISENTVKSRMRYALQFLRGYVAEFEGHSFDFDDGEVRTDVPTRRG